MAPPPQTVPPPPLPPSAASRLVPLMLRIVTLLLLMVSLIILTTNTATLEIGIYELKFHFNDVYSYRYMLSTVVFGAAYSLLQIAFGIFQVSQGSNLVRGDNSLTFNFYGDKIISYFMATGAAAGFGATKDLEPLFDGSNVEKFFHKGYASASMLLLAFVCAAAISVFSSYALPKRL